MTPNLTKAAYETRICSAYTLLAGTFRRCHHLTTIRGQYGHLIDLSIGVVGNGEFFIDRESAGIGLLIITQELIFVIGVVGDEIDNIGVLLHDSGDELMAYAKVVSGVFEHAADEALEDVF